MEWLREMANGVEVVYYHYTTPYGEMSGTEEYLAVRNEDGTFNVSYFDTDGRGKKADGVPFMGSFVSYRELDSFVDGLDDRGPNGFVAHVDHNSEDAFIYFPPEGEDVYIRVS